MVIGWDVDDEKIEKKSSCNLRFAFTHQKIPAPAAPREPTSSVRRAVRVTKTQRNLFGWVGIIYYILRMYTKMERYKRAKIHTPAG